jgi:hypothetical protein
VERQDLHSLAELTTVVLQKRGLITLGRGLGIAARSITSLDLSRNKIAVLDGFSSLVALKSLSLYFNHVADLSEALRLRDNRGLVKLDLRLNSVTRLESYRDQMVVELPALEMLDKQVVNHRARTMATARIKAAEESAAATALPGATAGAAASASASSSSSQGRGGSALLPTQENDATLRSLMNDALMRASGSVAMSTSSAAPATTATFGGAVGKNSARLASLMGQRTNAANAGVAAAVAEANEALETRIVERVGELEPSPALAATLAEMEARLVQRIDAVASAAPTTKEVRKMEDRLTAGLESLAVAPPKWSRGVESAQQRRRRASSKPLPAQPAVEVEVVMPSEAAALSGAQQQQLAPAGARALEMMEERLSKRLYSLESAIAAQVQEVAAAAAAQQQRPREDGAGTPPPEAAASSLTPEALAQIEASLSSSLDAKLGAKFAQLEERLLGALAGRFDAVLTTFEQTHEAHEALIASNVQLRKEAAAHEQTLRVSRRSFEEVRALYEKSQAASSSRERGGAAPPTARRQQQQARKAATATLHSTPRRDEEKWGGGGGRGDE